MSSELIGQLTLEDLLRIHTNEDTTTTHISGLDDTGELVLVFAIATGPDASKLLRFLETLHAENLAGQADHQGQS